MILDEIAEKARVRAAESKKRISPDVMAEKAKQKAKATEPFRFEKLRSTYRRRFFVKILSWMNT